MSQAQVLLLDENRGFGGAERHVVELARELDRRSLLVGVGARKDSWLYEHCHGLPVAHIGFRNEVDMFSVFALYKLIKARQCNVVHCIAHRDLVTAALARLLPGCPAVILLKAEHSFPDRDLSPLFRWAYRQCEAIVCVSRALRERAEHALSLGDDWTGEWSVVANGIELVPQREPRSAPQGRLKLGVLSALRPGKGQLDLLQALSGLTPSQLDRLQISMAGDGPMAAELSQRAVSLGLEVDFVGHVEDPASYLAELDLCVLPSHLETFSLVALECLCQGVPLLAAGSAGVRELYSQPEMIYPVGDVSALAQGIAKFMVEPGPYRQRAADLAEGYRQNYSQQAMGQRYQELYERLLQRLSTAGQR